MTSTASITDRLGARIGSRSRGWTASVAGHGVLMAWLMCSAPQARVTVTSGDAVPVALALAEAVAGPDDDPGARGGGAPDRAPAEALEAPAPAAARPRAPRARPATAAVPSAIEGLPFPAPGNAAPDDAPIGVPSAEPTDEPPQPDEASDSEVGGGGGGGHGTGTGLGAGSGIGEGRGTGEDPSGTGRRRRRPELSGRVIGENRPFGYPSRDQPTDGRGPAPYLSIHEATKLRTYDFFPQLPAALWSSFRPYVVVVDLCVSPEGRVSDAEFVVRASAALDPIVLAAVRTWRYRPRVVGGAPRAFCHLITIQYDPS